MAKSVQELREEGVKLANRIQQLRDKLHSDDGWTDEERQEWQTVGERYNEVTRQADELETVDQRANEIARLQEEANERLANPGRGDTDGRSQGGQDGPTDDERALAMQGWVRAQQGMPISDRHQEAASRCGISPFSNQLRFNVMDTQRARAVQRFFRDGHPDVAPQRAHRFVAEQRASLTNQSLGSGGALIAPETFITNLEINRLSFGGLLQVAELIVTNHGERMGWPTADDTSNTGEQVDSGANLDNAGAGGPTPAFKKTYWDAYKFSSKAVLVDYELLEDEATAPMVPQMLGEMLGERIGRVTNDKYTNGDGNATAVGILNAAALGLTADSATAIAAEEIIELEHAVDPAYRNGAGYMMHDSIMLAIRLLKDSEGQFLWRPGLAEGRPDTLNARSITINQDMPSTIAANNKTIVFGQLSRYKVRRVRTIRLYRLQEKYRDTDQDGFMALVREDGNLLNAGTPSVVYMQQAA